jgi:AbrB family looped-hinge helix DNA binding protein
MAVPISGRRAAALSLAFSSKARYLTSVKPERTRLSTKGQVVLPAAIRRQLMLHEGDEMTVEVSPDDPATILLRVERLGDVDRVLEEGARWFERVGRDLVEELHAGRRRERARERRRRP